MDYTNSLEHLIRARRVSPCGSQTLSKKAECFVEGAYPCFVQYGEGPYVWDVDGNRYLDFICGLGCLPLGHYRTEIASAILAQLNRGISFSLPTTLEAEVAERLVEKIPCAEQIRFVKTGSEACAGAARIARMVTGGDVVIYVGYHGWHDGYMSSAEFHPGVPDEYSTVNVRVPYNDLPALAEWFQYGGVAAVMMEPTLLDKPDDGYLEAVKDLVHEHDALLIFDEMIMSGRWALAGGQEYFGVIPDLAIYGKFLGNGMPLAAIAGPGQYMKHAWPISGTFGGEALSLAACHAVLSIYEQEDPVETQWQLGTILYNEIKKSLQSSGVGALIEGYAVHPRIRFLDDDDHVQMSIFLQELAAAGVLIHQGGFNISAAMTIEDTMFAADTINTVLHGSFEKDRLRGVPYRDALRNLSA